MNIYLLIGFFASFSLIYSQKISSVQLYNPQSKDFSSSIFELGSPIVVEFDDLSENSNTFFYTITHHDANWEKSILNPAEYIRGLQRIYLNDFSNSFNTVVKYRHYNFSIPNENMQLLLTGNYMLNIYSDSDYEKPLIQRKFCLYQNRSPLQLSFFRNINSGNNNQRIQIEFNNNQLFTNNFNNLKLVTIQNNNFDSTKQYQNFFLVGNKILYNGFEESFEGANEYYFFDTKIINIAGFSTAKIAQENSLTHVYLFPNQIINSSQYVFKMDINGGFVFKIMDLITEYNEKISADYVKVHFSLAVNEETDKKIYVVGGFNNWQFSEENNMQYNYETKTYELTLLLKQGFYNYTFATETNNKLNFSELNGSYWQTENNYKSLLYFRSFGGRYDELIGFGEIGQEKLRNNSLN